MTSFVESRDRRGTLAPPPRMPGNPISNLLAFRADPLGFVTAAQRDHGDVVEIRLGPERPVFVFGADDIKHVLVDNQHNYDKQTRGYNLLRTMLGNGLVTSEGEVWRRQRRIAQPAFHKARIARLGEVMQQASLDLVDSWRDPAAAGRPVDVADAMMQLTLKIAGLTLFSIDLTGQGAEVGRSVSAMLAAFKSLLTFPFPFAELLPTPSNLRGKRALKHLDRVVFDIIAARRQESEPHHDLLAMFMNARDEESGEGMSDQQLRDEVLTMLMAGHETTANALAWTLYLLSKNPTILRRVEDEIDRALDGRAPTMHDLAKLPYTDQVLSESMRLLPPVWMIGRRAIDDDVLGGHRIPANRYVFMLPYVTHRHPAYWENPEGFDPERFAPDRVRERPKHAYFPFASGPRKCIGDHFARMEAMIVLATLLGQYRIELVPGAPVVPEPSVTLRPQGPLMMRLRARHALPLAAE